LDAAGLPVVATRFSQTDIEAVTATNALGYRWRSRSCHLRHQPPPGSDDGAAQHHGLVNSNKPVRYMLARDARAAADADNQGFTVQRMVN
jgi:hypothetical protein